MQAQRINITLPYELAKQLAAEIPHGKRSDFIAKAVSEKLKKKRTTLKALSESLKANYEYDKKEYKEIWGALDGVDWPE